MVKKKKTKIGAKIGTAVLALVIFSIGYLFGHANLQLDSRYIPRLVNKDLGKPSDISFGLFWDVYNELTQDYLKNVDSKKALYGAISGLVNSLDDPYSSFLTPEESKSFRDDLFGKLEGIGAEIGRRNGVPAIIAPLEGSPAEKAGLKSGDKILAVDGEYTENLSLDEVVSKIRGKKGTEVKLTILGVGEKDPKEVKIVRDEIEVQDVTWQQKNDVAEIRIRQFGDNSFAQFRKIADEIKSKKISKIIIDLRNNPGGLLDSGVETAGYFLPKDSVIVKQQPKNGTTEEIKSTNDQIFKDEKVIVLVNKGSASASEIFAGAIQDHSRGKIIGEKTFGKGTVQIYKDLDLGAALKLTIAQWLTPNGRTIEENGITPDIEITRSDEDIDADKDPQLDRARVEINKM